MIVFFARRLLAGILLLFVISTATFAMVFSAGPLIARRLLGVNATQQAVVEKAHQLGLDRSLPEQYWSWLTHALTGDFGTSWFTSQTVTGAVLSRLPVTLSIVLSTIVLAAILSVALGTLAAVRRGWIDGLVQVLAVIGYAIPGFVVAIVLATVFAVKLHLFPATGYTPLTVSFSGWATSLVLPVIALVIGAIASSAQQVRSAIIEIYERDFVRTLRTRGLSEREILFRHVLKAAAPPGLTVLSLQFIGLLGGTVIVEQIFSLPGIGSLTVTATTNGDLPVVLGIVVFTVGMVIVVNLLVDLALGWLNPKARVS